MAEIEVCAETVKLLARIASLQEKERDGHYDLTCVGEELAKLHPNGVPGTSICPWCQGVDGDCIECQGVGFVVKDKELSMKIVNFLDNRPPTVTITRASARKKIEEVANLRANLKDQHEQVIALHTWCSTLDEKLRALLAENDSLREERVELREEMRGLRVSAAIGSCMSLEEWIEGCLEGLMLEFESDATPTSALDDIVEAMRYLRRIERFHGN